MRATLDAPDGAHGAVVACPPHPKMGGSRTDRRLRAVADALVDRGVACVRFDYGPWDEGRGERRDARNALKYAHDRYETVGLFGYSFGAGVALLATAESDPQPAAVSALAPPATVGDEDVTGAVAAVDGPLQVVYGERDDTVDWRPVVERAHNVGAGVRVVDADHRFVGRTDAVADAVAPFLAAVLK